jgi:transposase
MELMFDVAAGIDVHRDILVVSVRRASERGREQVETRTYPTFHDGLVQMVAWFDEQGVPVAGLESTGVYWKPVALALRQLSPSRLVWLVNPAEVKQVPGRKTDVKDSEWLSKLVMHGLVAPSFLPPTEQAELRQLTRFRTKAVGNQTRSKNRIIKELESSGIKLASVCSDPLGKSGRAMLDALLEGNKTVDEIADLARGKLRAKIPELKRALAGTFTSATRFILQQLLGDLSHIERDIKALDEQITQRLTPWQRELDLLLTMPGLKPVAIAAILAEIGPDMSVFEKADRLAAWGGVAPGSNESAGKPKRAPTRKGDKYLRTILVQAAQAGKNARGSWWRETYYRLVPRLGQPKTIMAIAHKMLVAAFYMLRDGVPYRAPSSQPPPPAKAARLAQHYTKKLAALGFDVALSPIAPLEPTEAPAAIPAPAT